MEVERQYLYFSRPPTPNLPKKKGRKPTNDSEFLSGQLQLFRTKMPTDEVQLAALLKFTGIHPLHSTIHTS